MKINIRYEIENLLILMVVVAIFFALYWVWRWFVDKGLRKEFFNKTSSREPYPIVWIPFGEYEVVEKVHPTKDGDLCVITLIWINWDDKPKSRGCYPFRRVIVPERMFNRLVVGEPYLIEYDEEEEGVNYTNKNGLQKTAGIILSPEEKVKAKRMRTAVKKFFC